MVDIKNDFRGGLDLDTTLDGVAKNAYIDALNISRDGIGSNEDMSITNVIGNRLVSYSLPAGTNVCIGAVANHVRNTVIYTLYNSNGFHSVLEYSDTIRTITKIFENLTDSDNVDILGFTQSGKITGMNVYNRSEGDLFFFLDSLGRPTCMNITRFRAGEYTPVTRQIINVIKAPPLSNPSCIYGNDTSRHVNNLRNKFFRFKFRFVYDDNGKSVWSPVSAMPMPVSLLDDAFTNVPTNNNVIYCQFNSGAKNVKAIEIAMSFNNKTASWSDFQLVTTINKLDDSIADDTTFPYSFYNDSTYPVIDINESILLYDYVPDTAKAQDTPNGNVLLYGAITEGYDKDLVPNVVVQVATVLSGDGAATGSLTLAQGDLGTGHPPFPSLHTWGYKFSGIPAVGTTVTFTIKVGGVTTPITTHVTIAGSTSYTVMLNIVAGINSSGHVNLVAIPDGTQGAFYLYYTDVTYSEPIFTITPPAASLNAQTIATWKWSTERNIGLVYFDQNGKTNGVVYNSKVVFPPYSNDITGRPYLPYISTQIFHDPPEWAYSYQWVITKEATRYIYWVCNNVLTDSNYIYFDVSNFSVNATTKPTTAAVLSYSFKDGDRLRLIRPQNDDTTVFSDEHDAAIVGQVVNPTVGGVAAPEGTYIKIANQGLFSGVSYTPQQFIIELYTPGQPQPNGENEVYYEFGQQFGIGLPETADRFHKGNVIDQGQVYSLPIPGNPAISFFYSGDSYFRTRSIPLGVTGVTGTATFYIQDRNIVDFYISEVSGVDGRPNAIDINARREYFPTLVRHGQAYQANTNINGFNRFYPNDFDEYDYSYGDIERLKVRDRFIRVFQRLKVGVVQIYSQINKQPNGNVVTVVTDKLINPIQYYVGNYGIGEHATSLSSNNFADYFTTNIQGVICRVSNDGVDPLSILYKVNSFATRQLPLRKGNYKVYGAYDQRLNNYVVHLEATDTQPAYTLVFKEDGNTFETFVSLFPEMMCNLGTLLIAWKNGQLYTHDSDQHNTFFGVTYDSSITPVFNANSLEKKTFLAVSEVASEVWDCPEIKTSINSHGTTKQQSALIPQDFEKLEDMFHAGVLRDQNSIGGILEGDTLKGNTCTIKFRKQQPTNLVTLDIATLSFIDSPLTKT